MPLSAEIVRPSALAPADLRLWADLCDQIPAFQSPLLSPEFALAVGAVRNDARVAVLKRHGATVGFLGHHRRWNGYARPLGAPFADYHGVVAHPEARVDLRSALAAAGLRSFRHTGLIEAETGSSATEAAVEGHIIDLSSVSASEHLEALRQADAKRFKNWRRLSHKLEREQPDISYGPDSDPAALAAVVGWKQAQLRRSGLHDVLRPVWVEGMFKDLFERPEQGFGGLLLTLRVAGRPIAGHFGVRRGPVFHPWVAAFDPGFSAYSPGVLLMLRAIDIMPRLNLQVYDLSAGSDHYKKPFANAVTYAREGLTYASDAGPAGAAVRAGPLTRRMGNRLEQIAAVEPSLPGRLCGILQAVRDAPKRLGDPAPDLS